MDELCAKRCTVLEIRDRQAVNDQGAAVRERCSFGTIIDIGSYEDAQILIALHSPCRFTRQSRPRPCTNSGDESMCRFGADRCHNVDAPSDSSQAATLSYSQLVGTQSGRAEFCGSQTREHPSSIPELGGRPQRSLPGLWITADSVPQAQSTRNAKKSSLATTFSSFA